ncbi:unnamed protein product [Zymoseptoria tritici ST99CH_1A5]|uniref:SUN domain-containing protein n=3 Tax=Zymoseptoria tritici TaxID=1047171 RepID=F9XJM3_ZYMTI|nr:uncharacterized protein MYCGRDRAFT_95868 [Zymoseptoria tritici IPO323]EGP84456.1 hypothetical protein MYCGRDRAFT_95868 [Zymoseptoria tritici IPO323]SMR58665.1 unnamed protein product [Zymoseptoria tritici ST99CH_1E4]SMR61664.1 unnamed protein product [Zymoseptoria tritici ST99CH_3D1]SMY27877.1 unnamed protein product [Zymoseptoria tritici ST99CH_1A5]
MATPRVTRSRASATPQPQALEAAQHRPNFSYGTRGPAAPNAQVANDEANFDNVFQSSRATPQPEPVAKPGKGKAKQQDSMEPESAVGPRPPTRFQNPGLYEDGEPGPPPRPPVPAFDAAPLRTAPRVQTPAAAPLRTAPRVQTPAAAPIATAPVQPAGNVQPWSFTVFLHAVPRWVKEATMFKNCMAFLFLATFLLGVLTAGLLTASFLPVGPLGPARDSLLGGFKRTLGLPYFDLPPNSTVVDTRLWGNSPALQEQINAQTYWNREFRNNILAQIEITGGLRRDLSLANETLSQLSQILPSMMAVVERDGKLEIPEIFWDALLDKVGSDAAAPLWENFLRLNEDWLAKQQNATLQGKLDTFQVDRKLIDREEFTATLERNQAYIDSHLDEHLDAFRTKLLHDAQREVQRQATTILESSPAYKISRAQLSTLALTNLLMNINDAQRDINWLTRATDALIDPRYTSKTQDSRIASAKTWYQRLFIKLVPAAVPAYPPAMALLGWDEAGQCWCTPTSKGETEAGQLGVLLGHTISPQKFYIEHVPARATRNIHSAPQEFELWAQMNSSAEVKRVHDIMVDDDYYYQYPPEKAFKNGGPCGKPPRGEDTWICILRQKYDIHNHNHFMNWEVPFSPALNMTTNRIVVRAKTNWGAPHTCFYRVRLTGVEVRDEPDPERPIPRMEPKEIDNSYMMKTMAVDRRFI